MLARCLGGSPRPGLLGLVLGLGGRWLVAVLRQPRLCSGAWSLETASLEAGESRGARDSCRRVPSFNASSGDHSRLNDWRLGRGRRATAGAGCRVGCSGREAVDGRLVPCAAGRRVIGFLLVRIGDLGRRRGCGRGCYRVPQGFGKETALLIVAGRADGALQRLGCGSAPLSKTRLLVCRVHRRPHRGVLLRRRARGDRRGGVESARRRRHPGAIVGVGKPARLGLRLGLRLGVVDGIGQRCCRARCAKREGRQRRERCDGGLRGRG